MKFEMALLVVGILFFIASIVVYSRSENNSYSAVVDGVKDLKTEFNTTCKELGERITNIRNTQVSFNSDVMDGQSQLRKAIAESQNEIAQLQLNHRRDQRELHDKLAQEKKTADDKHLIMETRQRSLEKAIIKKEQTINHNHTISSGATPFTVLDATPKMTTKKPLLDRAGVTEGK